MSRSQISNPIPPRSSLSSASRPSPTVSLRRYRDKPYHGVREPCHCMAQGSDVTIVALAMMVPRAMKAAENAMIAKAEEIGLKKVAQQKVSKFLSRQDVKMPHLSIFQFCNPLDARLMVMADPVFSSYMPCRISMVEDGDGKLWLMMLNLDMLINSKLLPAEVIETAIRVNQQMLDVMTAGASGKS